MDYNNEFNNLIENAKGNGFEFKDDKFIQTQEQGSFVPVMEIYFMNNSTYESFGYYHIFKKTYMIDNIEFNNVFEYAKRNDYKTVKWNGCCDDDIFDSVLQTIKRYDESNIDYINVNIGGSIDIQVNEYSKYTGDDEVVDIHFSKDNDHHDFPRGFVSFYMMGYNDFINSEEIDFRLEKFMRDN